MHVWIWIVSFTLGAGPQWSASASSLTTDCPDLRPPLGYTSITIAEQIDAREPASTPLVFDLLAGRLKPQVEQLLREHFAIQHLVWQAPEGLQWMSNYQLTGNNWVSMLDALLAPYHLRIQIYANHTAVVSQLNTGATL